MPLLNLAETPSPTPEPTRYIDPSVVTPGFIGFVIFVALAVGTFFLWRSMNKQLKRINFDEPDDSSAQPAAGDDQKDGPQNRGTAPRRGSDGRPLDLRDP